METRQTIVWTYGNLSGLILNTEKCEGLWPGRDKALQLSCNLFGIKWPEQLRCLGVYLGHNKLINVQKNFGEKVENIENTLSKWQQRDLTLFGRVQIIKTFALSKITLPATVLCVPSEIITRDVCKTLTSRPF